MDMSDYEISNNKIFRYTFVIIGNFSINTWGIPLKMKYSQMKTGELSKISTISKPKFFKLEND